MKTLVLFLYVFAPPTFSFFIPTLRTEIIALHAVISEFVLTGVIFVHFQNHRKHKERADSILFLLSSVCLLLADTIYNFKVITHRDPNDFISSFGEALYTGFMFFLFLFLKRRLSPSTQLRSTLLIGITTGLAHAILTFLFILFPFYTRDPAPTHFNLVNSTTYAILSSMVFGIIVPNVILTTRSIDHWFLQAIMFLTISDFAIRYQFAFVSQTTYSFADPGWNLSISAILALVLSLKRNDSLLDKESQVTTHFSVRCLLTLVICSVNILFLFGILIVNLFTIKNAFHLTEALFLMFFIWAFANTIASKISKDFLSIEALMLSADPKLVGPSGSLSFQEMKVNTIQQRTFFYETNRFIDGYNLLVRKMNHLLEIMLEQVKKVSMGHLATQVAHDIRSPLTALDVAMRKADSLPEEQRIMIKSATNRIRDIANNLLVQYRELSTVNPHVFLDDAAPEFTRPEPIHPQETRDTHLLTTLIEPLITEKRLQYSGDAQIAIEFEVDPKTYGVFAEIQPNEFKRMLSNLINNAAEAMTIPESRSPHSPPRILVWLEATTDTIILQIRDNGKGIPPEVLPKLGQRGETHGKSSGTGLGLYHARTTTEKWGGAFKIESTLEQGTIVTLTLPRQTAPQWFVSELVLLENSHVAILDDDPSIHDIWDGRFKSLRVQRHGLRIHHFSELKSLTQWVLSPPAEVNEDAAITYLVDYELLGQVRTGLDVIEDLVLAKEAILVTSRYEEKHIRDRCERLGVPLIPKGMAPFIPIRLPFSPLPAPHSQLDAVVIDDDPLVHMSWQMAAKENNQSIRTFESPEQFLADSDSIDPATPIYIDQNLRHGVKGDKAARTIFERGFRTIYLATGETHTPSNLPKWITKVVGKNPFEK